MPRRNNNARPPKPKRGQAQAPRMTVDVRIVRTNAPMTSTIGELWEWKDKTNATHA